MSSLSAVCLVCNVQLTDFIIVFLIFFSNKWVDALCDWSASTDKWVVVFHKIVQRHCSVGLASLQFSDMKFPKDSMTKNYQNHFSPVVKNIRGGAFFCDIVYNYSKNNNNNNNINNNNTELRHCRSMCTVWMEIDSYKSWRDRAGHWPLPSWSLPFIISVVSHNRRLVDPISDDYGRRMGPRPDRVTHRQAGRVHGERLTRTIMPPSVNVGPVRTTTIETLMTASIYDTRRQWVT